MRESERVRKRKREKNQRGERRALWFKSLMYVLHQKKRIRKKKGREIKRVGE